MADVDRYLNRLFGYSLSELLRVEVAGVASSGCVHNPVIVILWIVGVEKESLAWVPSCSVSWLVVTIGIEVELLHGSSRTPSSNI